MIQKCATHRQHFAFGTSAGNHHGFYTVGGLTTRSDHKVGGGSVPQKTRSEGARTTRSDPTQGRRGLWAARSISFQQFGPFFDGSKVETSKCKNYGRIWSYSEIRPPNESSPRDLSNGHGFRGPCFQGVSNLGRPVHPLPAVWTGVILECQNSKVSKIGFDHPKRCGRFGGPWETGFRAEIPEI